MVEAVLESLHEWATDRGLDLGPDSNLPLWDGTRPDYDWAVGALPQASKPASLGPWIKATYFPQRHRGRRGGGEREGLDTAQSKSFLLIRSLCPLCLCVK
jgi:hypothetical protein